MAPGPAPSPPALREGEVRLICFPYSGGAAAIYHPWTRRLPQQLRLYPVELPGRGRRLSEPPFTRLQPLVEAVAAELSRHLDGPFALFGHSMGALLAYELACHLREVLRREPVHLFISGHGAPQLPDRGQLLHDLPDDRFIEEVLRLNGTDERVLACPELREILLPILRADFCLCETYEYRPRAPLSCPMTVLSGLQDPFLQRSDLEAWRETTRGPFRLRLFPGDHFYIRSRQADLLEALARDLLRSSVTSR